MGLDGFEGAILDGDVGGIAGTGLGGVGAIVGIGGKGARVVELLKNGLICGKALA